MHLMVFTLSFIGFRFRFRTDYLSFVSLFCILSRRHIQTMVRQEMILSSFLIYFSPVLIV